MQRKSKLDLFKTIAEEKWSPFLQLQAEERIACTSVETDTTNVLEEELQILYENPLMVESNVYYGLKDRNFTKAILEWFSEIDQFVPSLNSCAYYRRCSNLNHMLNAGHTQIGCAYRSPCSNQQDDAFVCLYTGGFMEIPFFKTGPPCTKCHGLSSFCDDGLCAPCMGEAEYCEECKNPNMYEDWDICADIDADLCISPDKETRDMFRHFCPEQCTCRK
ncbi:hypothetical protein ACJMK2_009310 [Sinanodonta woodiana]|uniref:SCP domain-containing protein n=1 Tax=Sinanodonta woodiana TaxID=1069815 RepID=A0ABD3VEY0_SINWO